MEGSSRRPTTRNPRVLETPPKQQQECHPREDDNILTGANPTDQRYWNILEKQKGEMLISEYDKLREQLKQIEKDAVMEAALALRRYVSIYRQKTRAIPSFARDSYAGD